MNTGQMRIPLSELMPKRTGSTDPKKHPGEVFTLYSIPAYDRGSPEITKSEEIGSAKKNVLAGDVLLSRIVPHIRRSWIVEDDAIASGEWIIFRDPNVFGPYLRHFLLSDPFHVQFMRTVAGVGGSLLRARPAEVGKIEIPLPPLDEQRRIAAILDKADSLRQKRKQAIALLDSLTQSIFLEMFGDPVSNPKGWPTFELGGIATSRLGKMLDKKKMGGLEQFPYLANFNVQWDRLELGDLRTMGFSEKDRIEFQLQDGDLLVCEGGEIGRAAIWRDELENCYFQKALHRIRCNLEKCLPEYLLWYFWFMAKSNALSPHSAVATIAHLTGVKIKRLKVPIPPIEMQQKFASLTKKAEAKEKHLEGCLLAQEDLFSSLQHRAFTGEL